MSVLEIGQKLVAAVNKGREAEDAFVKDFYADAIVSIEGQGTEEMPARLTGIDAVKGKHSWWFDNHEIHESAAAGPYVGHRNDQFVVRFNMDITPKGGERAKMEEVGLYTVADGKIIQEEFLYRM